MTLQKLPHELTVMKLPSTAGLRLDADFFFLAKTDGEISLVCRTEDAPDGTEAREDGWRGFRVEGTLDFSLVGILARLTGVLAERGIPVFAVSTYDTDYILVKAERYEEAARAFEAAGYGIRADGVTG